MMTLPTVLRQIAAGNVERIEAQVSVEYDNHLQTPISFQHAGQRHEVVECLGIYRQARHQSSVLYLVRASDQVYALCIMLSKTSAGNARGRWILRFRVSEPQEEPMLVDFQLKRIADFHGHLCPELVIGYRACLCALAHLNLELLTTPGLHIQAENTTSAVDAIQYMTGCTAGNGRLVSQDHGKHVYTFVSDNHRGIRLVLKPNTALFDPEFLMLETRVQDERATLEETARYQMLLDERILSLLHIDETALFEIQPALTTFEDTDLTSALVACSRCGELTAPTHLVVIERKRICLACASQVSSAAHYGLSL